MARAVILSTDEQRGWDIRQALGASDVDTLQVYTTSHALLHGLSANTDISPDILAVDENCAPMPMWDLVREVASRTPALAILVVLADPAPEDFAAALDNGARGVVRYPLSYEEVSSRVENAVAWSASVKQAVQKRSENETAVLGGRLVAIASSKGGAGSSSVALHLGLETARSRPGDRVVVVDLDLQKPDLSILFDIPRYRDITDLLPVVEELTPRHLQDVVHEHASGLSLLLGPQHGERGELVTEFAARQILGMLVSRSDVVIVDVGSVMGEANSVAVEMADEVIVCATPDVLSLRGVQRITELWSRLSIRDGGPVKALLNKVDKKSDLQPETARRIVTVPTLSTSIPHEFASLELAVNRRDPELAGAAWSSRIEDLGIEMSLIPSHSLDDRSSRPRFRSASRSTRTETAPDASDVAAAAPAQPDSRAATTGRSRFRSDRGAVSIEAVGITALFALFTAIAFQVLLVGVTAIFASNAANEGARAAAVGASASHAAHSHTPQGWRDGLQVRESPGRVSVELSTPLLVPTTEGFDLTIPASAGVVKEPY